MIRRATCGLGLVVALHLAGTAAAEPAIRFTAPRSDYLLGCGGCHGYDGVSNSSRVPTLKGLVGYYLNSGEGRAYLARLPNVAFSNLNDEELAAVLNYMVFDLGAGSAPPDAKRYEPAEVGMWRKRPLTEVRLSAFRRQLVDTLIDRYHAPAALRDYGGGPY